MDMLNSINITVCKAEITLLLHLLMTLSYLFLEHSVGPKNLKSDILEINIGILCFEGRQARTCEKT